ncbi:MAG: DUF4145 domain-containing protein [Nanoarchaeota archaeon]
MTLQKNLVNLQNAISLAIKNNLDPNKKLDEEKAIYDFSEKQKIYYSNNLKSNLKMVKSDSLQLPALLKFDHRNEPVVTSILESIPELDVKDLNQLNKVTAKLIDLTKQLNYPKEAIVQTFILRANVPAEIKSEIKADLIELNKCFNNECYRSSIILCGRLLETALHRKYYESTNNDLLEKSPGIGLGNIIAKLKDKNVALDPALTNQVHLLNQVRIFSVHTKKEAFKPTKQQTHAAILYTLDILEKLF